MNVTRAVVTDLLPIYFSHEASPDTKTLVEEYFRQDPDFERIARIAATPLETLRAAAPAPAGAENEKRGLERARRTLQRRMVLFSVALFNTLFPLSFQFAGGKVVWLMVRDAPWQAVCFWGLAGLFWYLYFARPSHRTASLVAAISFTVIPIPLVVHAVVAGDALGAFPFVAWMLAVVLWIQQLRPGKK
jgi:nitrate reductase NapE component